MLIRTFLAVIFSVGSLFAKALAPSSAPVEKVLTRYRRANAVQANVDKKVIQELMGTTTQSQGHFYFSKGKLRLEIVKPERSILVYDGRNIWLESQLDESQIQVSHMKAGALRRTDSLMAALFDRKEALSKFKLLKVEKIKGDQVYSFEPKEKKKTDVRYLEVALKGKDIHRILYKDQMENTVSFEFSDLNQKKVPPAKFHYHPPKGASVTEL